MRSRGFVLCFALKVAACFVRTAAHSQESHSNLSKSKYKFIKSGRLHHFSRPGRTLCPRTGCLFCTTLITEYTARPGSLRGCRTHKNTSERADYTVVKRPSETGLVLHPHDEPAECDRPPSGANRTCSCSDWNTESQSVSHHRLPADGGDGE